MRVDRLSCSSRLGETFADQFYAPLYECDTAGLVAVTGAAGLKACQLDGHPLTYNRINPSSRGVLITHSECVGRALGTVGP